jgi:HK97 family phage portal protein
MGLIQYLGNLLGSSRQSERQYFSTRVDKIGGKGAIYLDTETAYQLVNSLPQLKIAVEKLAAMFSNGYLVKEEIKTGKIIEDPELQRLLENPNILQSQNEFLKQYISQLIVYGNQFIYKNQASRLTPYPNSITNVSPALIQPILTGKYFDQVELSGIIKEYLYNDSGQTKYFSVEDILWNKISDLDNPLVGVSPIKALKYPVTNTKYAYDYLNVISADKGAIGILSTMQKDGMGAFPMSQEERTEIENTYRNEYGTAEGQKRIHLTEGTVTWTPMTYPTRDLLLMEQIDTNFKVILDAFGINPNIFINSTYENLKHGLVMTYQDTVIPYADQFTQSLTKFLKVKEGYRVVAKFDHISILKEDEGSTLLNFEKKSNSLNQLVSGGIITTQQANEILFKDLEKIGNQGS